MKNIVLLLALALYTQDVFCNEAILSKFHQHEYKLKDVRMELISYNKDYINFFEIKAFKCNRTTTAHNFTINFKEGVGDKIEVVAQMYKFLSNEYRHFPVRFQINVRKAFDANAIGAKKISKCGNITSFYFYKNMTYHACNFVIDDSHLPPLIPSGKYKDELTFLFLNQEIALVYFYNEVYTPTVYPKE